MRQGASRNVWRKRRPLAKDGRGAGTVDDIILIKLLKGYRRIWYVCAAPSNSSKLPPFLASVKESFCEAALEALKLVMFFSTAVNYAK